MSDLYKVVEKFRVILQFETIVDTSTGEIQTRCIKKTIDKEEAPKKEVKKETKKETKKEESSTPQLVLEDNKYTLNKVAIELMGVTTDDKIDIKYEKQGKDMIPIIGTDFNFKTTGGNKFSKNGSVACRGSKNTELSKYGKVFEIVVHPSKEGIFILKGDKQVMPEIAEPLSEDESISFPDDISDLIDEESDVQEISASMFQL